MTPTDAREYAHELLEACELEGWRVFVVPFSADPLENPKRYGKTSHKKKLITINSELLGDDAQAQETIRHEIAHVIGTRDCSPNDCHDVRFARAYAEVVYRDFRPTK